MLQVPDDDSGLGQSIPEEATTSRPVNSGDSSPVFDWQLRSDRNPFSSWLEDVDLDIDGGILGGAPDYQLVSPNQGHERTKD